MGDILQDAVRYISDSLKDDPNLDRLALIEEVSGKFDLNPMQQEFLMGKFLLER